MKILSDVMELLFKAGAGQTIDDITLIMKSVLRTVIQTTIQLDRDSALVVSCSSLFTSSFKFIKLIVICNKLIC